MSSELFANSDLQLAQYISNQGQILQGTSSKHQVTQPIRQHTETQPQ